MKLRAPLFSTLGPLLVVAAALGSGAVASFDREVVEADAAQAVSRSRARAAARALRFTVEVRADAGGGAGFVVDAEGFVLTALHVVEGAGTLSVRTSDGEEHPAQVFAKDPPADLALLRLLAPRLALPVATIVDDAALGIGESLLAVGSPFGLHGSVSAGILSGRGRRGILDDSIPLLQTDAAVHPGSSGGPLVNVRGEVVGAVTSVLHDRGVDLPIAFAVPSGEILRALPALRRGEAVERPWIGARIGRRGGLLEVLEVRRGGPGDRAGLEAGDRIERVGGRNAGTLDEFRALLGLHRPGETVPVVVRRSERAVELEIVVGTLP